MVNTVKFSQFAVAPLTNANNEVVGLEGGVNVQSVRFLSWTTATRPATPFNGLLGVNTDLQQYEWWDAVDGVWNQLEDSGDISGLIARLAAHTPGDGASMIGLLDQSGVISKTVQDLANATFIAQTDNGTLENAQFLGSLTTGIVKNTTVTGVLSISAPLTSIDGLTTVANNLLYTTAPNVYAVIAPVNSAALVTSAGGVPSLSQTLPTAVQSNITQLGAQSQALNMNTHLINNVVDPLSPQDAATKHYVDQTSLNGTSVYAASAASLGTVTQSGAGAGATLTNAGVQATFALDGVNPPVGTNVLIKDTAVGMTAANEGIYIVTSVGSGATNWVLTRSTSYDTPTEINNTGLIVIQNGSTLAGTAWFNTSTIVTVDTTAFNYAQFGNIIFPLTLAQGGTSAALTASNGGIVYSTATAMAILSGTATANQIVLSGASSAPSWSPYAMPALVGTAGNVLTSDGTNFVSAAPNAATSTIVNDTTTNATMFPVWVTANTGSLPLKVTSTKLFYNPSTSLLTNVGALAQITNIQSSAGAPVLAFTYTASAVNNLRIFNNTAGNAPDIIAEGSDSAIGIVLSPKNGFVQILDYTGTIGGTLGFSNAANTFHTFLKVATAQATTVTFTLPALDGIAGSVVTSSGAGVWSMQPQNMLQQVSTQTGAVATGTTQLPADDSIPQNGEGNQYLTLSITPKLSTSKLRITITVMASHSVGTAMAAALFQDATANALAAQASVATAATLWNCICFTHEMTSGTTSSTTFNVRVGNTNVGTTTLNGTAGGRLYGGVLATGMTITEYSS